MTSRNTLQEEVLSLALNAAFFGAWFLAFLVVKDLILAEYRIGPSGVTAALVAALVVAKVVLLLEHVELGSLVQSRPAWVEVALRTALYAIGALVVMLLEKSFETRHEAGGFVNALAGVLHHRDIPHVVANALSVTGALLLFNAKSVVQRHLGSGALLRMFTQPMPGRLRMKRF